MQGVGEPYDHHEKGDATDIGSVGRNTTGLATSYSLVGDQGVQAEGPGRRKLLVLEPSCLHITLTTSHRRVSQLDTSSN
jgi:hypothetical protein